MDAEMRYHIECETADRVRQGMTPDDARRSAMRDFGGVERHKEDARDARGLRPLDDSARALAMPCAFSGKIPDSPPPSLLRLPSASGVRPRSSAS